jgi:hypothetical protein
MDKLKELLGDFDLEQLLGEILPDLTTLMGQIELLLRLLILVGPLILLGLGLYYFINPPAEANYSAGYRCGRGMTSVEAWQFTQRTAGSVWILLGGGLTVAMVILGKGLAALEPMEMLLTTVKYLAWQAGLVLISTVVINLIVVIFYDDRGYRRERYIDEEE